MKFEFNTQLHEVVTLNGFQLTGVPCQVFICGISCLCNVFLPSWSKCCKEPNTEEEQEEEEVNGSGEETQGIDIRAVKICTLV